MLRVVFLLVFITINGSSFSQTKKIFTLEDDLAFDKVNIVLKATANSCFIKPSSNPAILNIFAHEMNESNPADFSTQLIERVQNVYIIHGNESDQLFNSLTRKIFSSGNFEQTHWDYFFSDLKPLRLNLDYAVGDANINLSGLPVEHLKIRSGNANVYVEYRTDLPNPVKMDSFFVKVDLGSLKIKGMDFARAKEVMADVSFGALLIDYTGKNESPAHITASVGAGNLIISFPENSSVPVIVKIHDSPLCHIKLPKNYRKIGKNVFVNPGYKPDAKNILTFDLEVAVGQIKFLYQ